VTQNGLNTFFLARDLSLGGLQLVAQPPHAPPVGHLLYLRLIVENETRVVEVAGEVIRHIQLDERSLGFAVQFVSLTDEQVQFLSDLIWECTEDETQTSRAAPPISAAS
jgi:hypothetical protein